MDMAMSWIRSIGSLLRNLPLILFIGYVAISWRFVIGCALILTVLYCFFKNVFNIIKNSHKLPKSALPLLIFLDIWSFLAKLPNYTILEISSVNSIIERMMIFIQQPCPSSTVRVEQVNSDCSVYVYTPDVIVHSGCLVYVHGGGWSFLSARSYSHSVAWMSHYLGLVVVSVEYRLAHQHIFPAALTDCYAALQWVFSSASQLGVDSNKVFVAGDSAGGNLSAALCLLHRDRRGQTGEPQIAGQILIYPVLQCYDMTSGSMDYNSSLFPSPQQLAQSLSMYLTGTTDLAGHVGNPKNFTKPPKFWDIVMKDSASDQDNHLKEIRSLEKVSPGTHYSEMVKNSYVFPLHAEDLSDLPPAYILVAAADTLRDEGEWYARYLEYFGVPTVFTEVKHCHGFMAGYNRDIIARGELLKIKGFIFSIGN